MRCGRGCVPAAGSGTVRQGTVDVEQPKHMSRATVVYILVLLACATAVTVVIERGNALQAPPDLSGLWEVTDANLPLGSTLLVEQSGRFVRLTFADGLTIDAKLVTPITKKKSFAVVTAGEVDDEDA